MHEESIRCGEERAQGRFDSGEGAVAQLGEHLVCNQGVGGSIPLSSTKIWFSARQAGWWFFDN